MKTLLTCARKSKGKTRCNARVSMSGARCAKLPGSIIKTGIARPPCRHLWASLTFLIAFYRTFPPVGTFWARIARHSF
jgi:hypothetical protein